MIRLVKDIAIGAVVLIAAAHIALDAAVADPVRGGTLSMILSPEPPNLVSGLNSASPVYTISPKMFDGLLDLRSAIQNPAAARHRVERRARWIDHYLHSCVPA